MTDLDRDGAVHVAGLISPDGLKQFEALMATSSFAPGHRLVNRPDIENWLELTGVTAQAGEWVGKPARPVRAIFFDKTLGANWALGWHQDRTIAVRGQVDLSGLGPWSSKAGIDHVEPPFEFIERMLTARIHLDDVPHDNAPLVIVPGSHRLGRITNERVLEVVARGPQSTHTATAGDIWWYRTAIVHSSARAARGGRRRVLHIDYSADELPLPLEWRGVS